MLAAHSRRVSERLEQEADDETITPKETGATPQG